jgi:hypothetical protein
MANIDRATFSTVCFEQGLSLGAPPHYMLAVAQLRSGISDGNQGDQMGPFRLKQLDWDANSNGFLPADIDNWRAHCAVFALWTSRAFAAFVQQNGRNPNAVELYALQFPTEPASAADLKAALDNTAALLPAGAAAVIADPAQPIPT